MLWNLGPQFVIKCKSKGIHREDSPFWVHLQTTGNPMGCPSRGLTKKELWRNRHNRACDGGIFYIVFAAQS